MSVTFDVKNAFNTVGWIHAMDALENKFRVPLYLRRVISDCLKNRKFQFETSKGNSEKVITAGVSQESLLGADLWNVSYEGVLWIQLPNDCKLIGFADALAVVILAKNEEDPMTKVSLVSTLVENWLGDHILALAPQEHGNGATHLTKNLPRYLQTAGSRR